MRSRTNLLLLAVVPSWFVIVAGDGLLAQEGVAVEPAAGASDEVAPEKKAVQDSLQGMWIAVSCQHGGKELTQPAVPCLVFEENRFTVEEGEGSLQGEYQINTETDPNQLEMTIGGGGGMVASFGFQDGKLVFCFDPTPNAPAPGKLESVEGDKQILVVLTPVLVQRFEGHTGPVSSVAFSPDGKLIASGSGWPKGDRTVRVWNASSGEEIRRIEIAAHITEPSKHGPEEGAGEVRILTFSADGRQLLVGGAGGFVHLYDVSSGKLARRFEGCETTAGTQNTVHGVAMSADGRLALAGGRAGRIVLWDVQSGDVLRRLEGLGWVRSLAILPDGRQALSGSFDRTVRLWDLESGKQLRRFETDGWVFGLAFSPDGRRAVAAIDMDDVGAPGVSPMYIWDLETGKQIHRIDAHRYGMTGVAFSPDGRHILSGGYDWTMRMWDAETGKELRQFPRHRDYVCSVACSPDGRFALSAGGGGWRDGVRVPGEDFVIRMWDLALATRREVNDEARPAPAD